MRAVRHQRLATCMASNETATACSAALDYVRHGWSVIPVAPRAKRPLIMWLDFQQRLPTEREINNWFRRSPLANVGIVTGAESGLIVLDIDPKHGGADSLAALERRHGALPATIEAVTGGGGRHLYFAHPGGIVHNRVAIESGIDLRGDGGFVVAPPSMHPSGARYCWAAGHGPQEISLAGMPDWLKVRLGADRGRAGHSLSYWRHLVREGVGQGERNNTIASLAGHLLWHGVDPFVALDLLLCWNATRCRPPLPEHEVVRTIESIARLHLRDEQTRRELR